MRHSFLSELGRRNRNNLRTLRQSPVAEISGALGDLGTLLPLMVALAVQGSIDLSSTLVFSGLFNIVTGAMFGIPLPVQPMKAIAASALSTPLSLRETTASGALVSLAVLLLSTTGLLRLLTRLIPVPVIKGIQLGAGLRLVTAGANLILPLPWFSLSPQKNPLDTRIATLIAFLLLLLTQRAPRFPYALLIFLLGLLSTLLFSPDHVPSPPSLGLSLSLWKPVFTLPNFNSPAAWSTALSQLPLTTLNSVIAVSALATDLLPSLPPLGVTSLGLSVAAMNLCACWFGAMPVCHGAGGLAAQHRFGARSGASVLLLGVGKMALGLFLSGSNDSSSGGGGGGLLVGILRGFPKGVLGVMVIAAGLELGKVGAGVNGRGAAADLGWEDTSSVAGEEGAGNGNERRWREVGVREQQERWMVMMVTAAGTLAFKSDAVGFVAGCCCHGAYRVADGVERRWGAEGERRPLLW
ncbi:hypothetical protein C8A03DRAFT_16920 [Achaetomium macrosporum]|uniref:Molybdate transporter 1 n=1 Tax=Achaetomium macrosporum TaxID=79813 RepID=A0AAN7C727_9PEZI|nr:hypothetical protein C8A03DRAFT_16920 [Achaetomium macrosporum]